MSTSAQRRSTILSILVAGAFFMENLDATIIATALPQMARSFHTSPIHLSSGMSAYMVALAVFVPISGWIADRLGSRPVFLAAIAIFTLASVLCGGSHSAATFTAARVLQGVGGAMMVPVGRLVVLRNTAKQDLMSAIAWLTWPALLAPLIGPPVGGAITTFLNWRWIFLLNVPLGLIAIICSSFLVPNERRLDCPALDGYGFVVSGSACVSLMYGLDLLGRSDSSARAAAGFVLVGLVLGWLTVRHSHRHAAPLLEFSALRIPTFAAMTVEGSLFRISNFAMPLLLPMLFQVGFGLNAFISGMLVLATSVGVVCMKPLTTPLLRWLGFRRALLAAGALVVLTVLVYSLLRPTTPHWLVFVALFVGGMAGSAQFTNFNTIGFADVPKPQMASANTLFSTLWQLNVGLGIAIGAIALQSASWLHGHSGHLLLSDFRLAFWFDAAIALAAVLPCLRLAQDAGAVVTGHAKPQEAQEEA